MDNLDRLEMRSDYWDNERNKCAGNLGRLEAELKRLDSLLTEGTPQWYRDLVEADIEVKEELAYIADLHLDYLVEKSEAAKEDLDSYYKWLERKQDAADRYADLDQNERYIRG